MQFAQIELQDFVHKAEFQASYRKKSLQMALTYVGNKVESTHGGEI